MRRVVSDDDIPQVLETLDLQGVSKYIQSDICRNIFVLAGAGISTSAGIPDFRSPKTGLYANLARLKLPYPEAVFDISFFRANPKPFYVLAHELAPGKFRPTLTHSFIRLLAERSRLHTCFTQNIDTLERAAGVPEDKIIEAHGSFANQHCIECGAHYPHDKIREKIAHQEIPICEDTDCGGYIKPDIVFFGESLPPEFTAAVRHLQGADLLIVMGTSLTVHPFASLAEFVPPECPRLLLNLDRVGSWGERANDVACLMPCDKAVKELSRLLGWEMELDKLWAATAPSVPYGRLEEDTEKAERKKEAEKKRDETKDEPSIEFKMKNPEPSLDKAIAKLAEIIGEVKLEDEVPEAQANPSEGKDTNGKLEEKYQPVDEVKPAVKLSDSRTETVQPRKSGEQAASSGEP